MILIALVGATFISILYFYKIKDIDNEVVREMVEDNSITEKNSEQSTTTQDQIQPDPLVDVKNNNIKKSEEESKNERLKLLESLDKQLNN